ncbi:hypothetical protein, partial [Bacillus pseudomycoides]|uniref:hypothetical protein n=1 Tax=Bacillus pseudomycoides TaxID=64104 RepID=UPI001C3F262E
LFLHQNRMYPCKIGDILANNKKNNKTRIVLFSGLFKYVLIQIFLTKKHILIDRKLGCADMG